MPQRESANKEQKRVVLIKSHQELEKKGKRSSIIDIQRG